MNLKSCIKLISGMGIVVMLNSCFGLNNTQEPTKEDELFRLNEYLKNLISAGNNLDTTDLGVYYVTIEAGEGDFPKAGDTLEVGYAGYFIDGQMFEASDMYEEDGTWEFILGNPPMIQGWDDGMKVINKNAKVQLIIPSDLAYGSSGSGSIAGYQTLVFVIRMVNIKPS